MVVCSSIHTAEGQEQRFIYAMDEVGKGCQDTFFALSSITGNVFFLNDSSFDWSLCYI